MKGQHGLVYNNTSGKSGGIVALGGRYGATIRSKVRPKQPVSNSSATQRSRFSSVAAAWRGLSADAVAGWNNAALTVKRTDRMGRPFTPSGFGLFAELNNNLLAIGKSILTTVPVFTNVPTLITMSATAVVSGGVVTLTYTPAVPAAQSYLIFATPPIPVGRKAKPSDFRWIHTLITADSSPYALTSAYSTKYGAILVTGNVVYFKATPVIWVPGQAGRPFECSATVTAS